MDAKRRVLKIKKSQPTIEGAGVRLKRAFGNDNINELDPFLLLDDFHSDNPEDYIAGFPWHPHRGMETVSYMLHGRIKHEDSMGNAGIIGPGGVQWMTAGSGIVHSEMPQRVDGVLRGLQLWVNLPAAHKMIQPRYQEVKEESIPEVKLESGVSVKVILGEVNGTRGPVQEIVANPQYLDVSVPPGKVFQHEVKPGYTVFAYVLEGGGFFDESKEKIVPHSHLVIFDDGDHIQVTGSEEENSNLRFILVAGKPIKEPIAWHGPMVMNTREELQIAFNEYQDGTFVKKQ